MYAKPFNVHTPTVRGTVSSLPSIFNSKYIRSVRSPSGHCRRAACFELLIAEITSSIQRLRFVSTDLKDSGQVRQM